MEGLGGGNNTKGDEGTKAAETGDLRDVIASAIRKEGTQRVAGQLRVSRDSLLAYAGRFPCRRATALLIEEQWRTVRGGAAA